jgi:DNA-binding GntR family transcriptional regulator
MNHGGIRKGAGRPATPVDDRRLLALRKEGLPMRAIAERFGVTTAVIRCALDRIKRNESATT